MAGVSLTKRKNCSACYIHAPGLTTVVSQLASAGVQRMSVSVRLTLVAGPQVRSTSDLEGLPLAKKRRASGQPWFMLVWALPSLFMTCVNTHFILFWMGVSWLGEGKLDNRETRQN